jgi:hypothetical protein
LAADNGDVGAATISKLLDLEYRALRVRLQKGLIIASLLAFTASLLMPAVRVHLDEIDPGTVGRGVQCLVMSEPYYASNVLLYTGPAWCWVLRRRRGPTMGAMLTIAAVLSLAFVVMAPAMIGEVFPLDEDGTATFLAGFYVWVGAHALMTVALALPLWGDDRREELAQLRGELAALERKWAPAKKAA